MKYKRIIVRTLVTLAIVAIASILICNAIINNNAAGKMFTSVNSIPHNNVGLLLGTNKFLKGGYHNAYYTYRIQAATQLFKAGKINFIIASGDNGRETYNAPDQMRADLMADGIDSSKIFCDYAGFRTFDSMIRLKEVLGRTA